MTTCGYCLRECVPVIGPTLLDVHYQCPRCGPLLADVHDADEWAAFQRAAWRDRSKPNNRRSRT